MAGMNRNRFENGNFREGDLWIIEVNPARFRGNEECVFSGYKADLCLMLVNVLIANLGIL
jgi:hypothetical protein